MYISSTGVASHVQGYEFKPLNYKINIISQYKTFWKNEGVFQNNTTE